MIEICKDNIFCINGTPVGVEDIAKDIARFMAGALPLKSLAALRGTD